LDGISGDTQERDDIRVGQVFPHGGHLVEGLGISLAPEHEEKCNQIRTILNPCGSPSGCTIRRIRTFEPSKVPSCTDPETDGSPTARRELESVCDFGRISLIPQIFFSSCKYSWNAELAWFDIDVRTCNDVGRALGRNGLDAHAIQVLDKPCQIFPLQTRNCTSIPFAAKEVAEVFVKLRRSSVEATEL